jgi:Flp pilus assembly protein TadG
LNNFCEKRQRNVSRRSRRHYFDDRASGQTLVEFAFILPIFLFLMLGVVQVILVGGAALAVNQAAMSCARYAALNPTSDQTALNTYMKSIASPVINDSYLKTLSLTGAPPRTTGSAVGITITYDLTGKLFLGTSFLGLTFPSTVAVTETMTSE